MIYKNYYTTSNVKGIKMRLIERTAKFKKLQQEKLEAEEKAKQQEVKVEKSEKVVKKKRANKKTTKK